MNNLLELPIIRGVGWGELVLGTTRENVKRFLNEDGINKCLFESCYFLEYPNFGILINYNLANKVNTIFFYNNDLGYEHMSLIPIKTKENIGWNSSPFDIKEAYGIPYESFEGIENNVIWQRFVYNGVNFRFLDRKLVRISINY
jgi:hypothetical protein